MIYGIGTDIVRIERLAALYQRHGQRALEKMLAPSERETCLANPHPERLLAKRFAAKEALAKALGYGVRAPVLLPAIAITHDKLGKPGFAFSDELSAWLSEKIAPIDKLHCHLSLSDETDSVVAFVIVEITP